MKKWAAVILLLLIFLQTFYQAGIALWFYANQTYIAKNICVNRFKPEMKCNGKCYLKKKLKQAEQQSEEQTPTQLKQWVESSPCTLTEGEYSLNTIVTLVFLRGERANLYQYLSCSDIYHPPIIS
jgi:flagellar basal body-associated protein FliL